MSQSGHTINQIKAEYLGYRMVPCISLLVKEFKIHDMKRTKIDIFSYHFFECG